METERDLLLPLSVLHVLQVSIVIAVVWMLHQQSTSCVLQDTIVLLDHLRGSHTMRLLEAMVHVQLVTGAEKERKLPPRIHAQQEHTTLSKEPPLTHSVSSVHQGTSVQVPVTLHQSRSAMQEPTARMDSHRLTVQPPQVSTVH